MLDVEALRLGRLKIAATATALRDLLAGCTTTARRGLRASLSVAADVPTVVCVDALRLRQVCDHCGDAL
jgi:hypothetical protein